AVRGPGHAGHGEAWKFRSGRRFLPGVRIPQFDRALERAGSQATVVRAEGDTRDGFLGLAGQFPLLLAGGRAEDFDVRRAWDRQPLAVRAEVQRRSGVSTKRIK